MPARALHAGMSVSRNHDSSACKETQAAPMRTPGASSASSYRPPFMGAKQLLIAGRALCWGCAGLLHGTFRVCPTCPAGLYEGVPVSIITTLMGMPNMDFVVREARAAVSGQMAVVRLGTCGALRPPARLGSFMIASPGAVCVRCARGPQQVFFWARDRRDRQGSGCAAGMPPGWMFQNGLLMFTWCTCCGVRQQQRAWARWQLAHLAFNKEVPDGVCCAANLPQA